MDTSSAGTYTVTYNVSDSAGNAAEEVARTVEVVRTSVVFNPVLSTDKDDYHPGEEVILTGRGFVPGEPLQIIFYAITAEIPDGEIEHFKVVDIVGEDGTFEYRYIILGADKYRVEARSVVEDAGGSTEFIEAEAIEIEVEEDIIETVILGSLLAWTEFTDPSSFPNPCTGPKVSPVWGVSVPQYFSPGSPDPDPSKLPKPTSCTNLVRFKIDKSQNEITDGMVFTNNGFSVTIGKATISGETYFSFSSNYPVFHVYAKGGSLDGNLYMYYPTFTGGVTSDCKLSQPSLSGGWSHITFYYCQPEQKGSLTVEKLGLEGDDTANLTLYRDDDGTAGVSAGDTSYGSNVFSDGETNTWNDLPFDDYYIIEDFTGITNVYNYPVTNPVWSGNVNGDIGSVSEPVEVNNTPDKGSITICKTFVGSGTPPENFNFKIWLDGETEPVETFPVAVGKCVTIEDLDFGTYNIMETDSGYDVVITGAVSDSGKTPISVQVIISKESPDVSVSFENDPRDGDDGGDEPPPPPPTTTVEVEGIIEVAGLAFTGVPMVYPITGIGAVLGGLGLLVTSLIRRKKRNK